jgi:hypothetical protein
MAQESATRAAAPSVWRNLPLIRGAAIAAMIVDHSLEFSLAWAGILEVHPAGWPAWQSAIELLGRSLGPQCIPVFLFVSGFYMYRFSRTWSAAWGSARTIGTRYVMWAVPGYVFALFVQRSMAPAEAAVSFVRGGPYYGTYWFLVLLFQLCLLAPLLARWVDASWRSALAFCVALQLVVSAQYYWNTIHGGTLTFTYVQWRLPFFFAGMILSSRSELVLGWLAARRRGLLPWVVLSQVAVVVESLALGLAFRGGNGAFAYDKLTFVVGANLLLAWFLTMPAGAGTVRTWLGTLGMNSMAVLLASDLFFAAMGRFLWHAGTWLGLPPPVENVPPEYMRTILVAIPFLVVGLPGPLLAASALERFLGKPARRLVFG